MRMIFLVTGLVLAIFSGLQFSNGNHYLASAELIVFVLLMVGAHRISHTRNLLPWIYAYLIPAFCFMILIMVIPNASRTAFVWIFMMPVLSYLLLGRKAGFLLAAPFMLASTAYNVYQFGSLSDASSAIDLFNPIICGLVILLFIHVYESMRSEAERQLVTLAQTDALTGLPNRSSFQAAFERVINESRRAGSVFALVLLDIDHFKAVNDSLGHDAGDEALRRVAQSLTQRLRSTDVVGRLGGEEFGLILREMDVTHTVQVIEELRQRMADSDISYGQDTIRLTVTLGVALWPHDGETTTALYQTADRRLYRGKHMGRNTTVWNDEKRYPSARTAVFPES